MNSDGIFPGLPRKPLISSSLGYKRYITAIRSVSLKSTKVVFIHKAGKQGYIATKSFRPISLTPFLFKSLKRIVDRYPLEGTPVTQPFYKNQYSHWCKRSTETVLHAIMHNSNTGWLAQVCSRRKKR